MVDYLAEAFKALDDVEDVMPCLHEEMFTVDSDGLSELADFEVESEKSEDKKRVIDPEAKNEEELKSSYVGKVIIDCNQCHSKIYKDKEDIVIDGDDANKEEECPYCFATEGFKVVGEVAPYTETKVDVEVEDKDTMTEGVRRRARAAKKMGKKVVEGFARSYQASIIIEDLVNRARLIYEENDNPDVYEAVRKAIDDGLIYNEDILELAGTYGLINYGNLVDDFYDELSYEVATELKRILAKEGKEFKESVKGKLAESDHIRRRGVGGTPYNRKRMSGRVRKDLDIDEKKSDNPRLRDNDEKRARRIDRKVNSPKDYKFVEDLGDDVAKYQRWVDYDMKRYGKISDKTKSYLDRAGLEVVKDDHDDYEVIAKDEGLSESLNEVEVKTDTDKIKISSETITKDDEMAIPVTDDTKDEIIAGGEEEDTSDEIVADDEGVIADDEEEDTVDDIEEFDEESFDELSESYLKKVYSNVDGYKTSNVSFNKSGLCVEGIISFKSGNKKNTQFIFESRDNGKRFVGENKQITRGKKAFTVKGSVKDGKFITESFNYRYSAINPQTGKSENLYETLKRGK